MSYRHDDAGNNWTRRDTKIKRTRADLAAAAANGRRGDRLRKVDHADAAKARALRDKGVLAADIAKMLGTSTRFVLLVYWVTELRTRGWMRGHP